MRTASQAEMLAGLVIDVLALLQVDYVKRGRTRGRVIAC